MRRICCFLLISLFLFIFTATAYGDEVTDWSDAMFRASLIAGASPLAMSRNAAIVQASVFDAVNGIQRRYTPIHVPPSAPPGASQRAAVVQAAYVALVKLYPTQLVTFDARRAVSLSSIAANESAAAIASGIAWGDDVANQIWAWRLTDGIANTSPSWSGNTDIGQWRPTPNDPYPGTSANGAGYPAVRLHDAMGRSISFLISSRTAPFAGERAVCQGLQRNEIEGQLFQSDQDDRPDHGGLLLEFSIGELSMGSRCALADRGGWGQGRRSR